MSKIATCLWFDRHAGEAAEFYAAVFRALGRKASITATSYYGESGAAHANDYCGDEKPLSAGMVLTVTLDLDGHAVTLMNGGPVFALSSAVSLVVKCADQTELDAFWSRLSDGGKEVQCGWLTDRFGLSWQVVPDSIDKWMTGDPQAAARVFAAIMPMVKLDIATLEKAHRGE